MKVLRTLPRCLYAELRIPGDMHLGQQRELTVVAPCLCQRAEKKKDCVCERAFIGSVSGAPSTLAQVCDEDDAKCFVEFISSPLARFWWNSHPAPPATDHLWRLSEVLEGFEVGGFVRTKWEPDGFLIYEFSLLSESEAFESLYGEDFGEDANESSFC